MKYFYALLSECATYWGDSPGLGASWVEFWWFLGLKLRAKLTKRSIIWLLVGKLPEVAKMIKKIIFFQCFWSFGLPTSKHNLQKASPDRSNINQKFGQHLEAIFDIFWNQLGSFSEGFRRPSWYQVGTKNNENPTPKSIKQITAVWKASRSILGRFGRPTWPPDRFLDGCKSSLLGKILVGEESGWGGSWSGKFLIGEHQHPRPRKPPKIPQDPPSRLPKTLPKTFKTSQRPLEGSISNQPISKSTNPKRGGGVGRVQLDTSGNKTQ